MGLGTRLWKHLHGIRYSGSSYIEALSLIPSNCWLSLCSILPHDIKHVFNSNWCKIHKLVCKNLLKWNTDVVLKLQKCLLCKLETITFIMTCYYTYFEISCLILHTRVFFHLYCWSINEVCYIISSWMSHLYSYLKYLKCKCFRDRLIQGFFHLLCWAIKLVELICL